MYSQITWNKYTYNTKPNNLYNIKVNNNRTNNGISTTTFKFYTQKPTFQLT